MRKSILFSALCLIAIVAVACGGNNAATGNSGNSAGGNAAGGGDDDNCGGSSADNCGGDDGGSDSADHYAIYRTVGNTWTLKSTTEIEGMDPMVSYMKTEVVEVADDHAMIKTWMLDKDQKPMAGVPEPEPTKIEFATGDATDGTDAPAVEQSEETVTVEAGEFDCTVTEVSGSKTWMSKEYPSLMVKNTHASGGMELVEYEIN